MFKLIIALAYVRIKTRKTLNTQLRAHNHIIIMFQIKICNGQTSVIVSRTLDWLGRS